MYIVGAGCGDFDLITLRGAEYIKHCDVLVYDSLIDALLLGFAPESAEKICVGKRSGRLSAKQENINEILVEKAKEGKTVVRLKGGDPFVFGRGGEEIESLKNADVPYDIVPGISSSIAVPELAGIPVTHRNLSRSVHIITGHTAQDTLPENIKKCAETDGTLVFLMGLKKLPDIAKNLIQCGKSKDTPVAVVSNGACAENQTVRGTLSTICENVKSEEVVPPVVIVVGEITKFDFAPTIKRPLKNISVTVTGTRRLSDKLGKMLTLSGAKVKKHDLLKVIEYRDNDAFDNAINGIDSYDYVVLTSMNGAEIFMRRLRRLKKDIRSFANVRFAVIGSGTAAVLEKYGIFADCVPNVYTTCELGYLLSKTVKKGEKVLILRAENGSPELTRILAENNINFDDVKTYDIQLEKKQDNSVVNTDFITFASASGVNKFFDGGATVSEKTSVVCIGEITAEALINHGVNSFKIARTKDTDGILQIIIKEAALKEGLNI